MLGFLIEECSAGYCSRVAICPSRGPPVEVSYHQLTIRRHENTGWLMPVVL